MMILYSNNGKAYAFPTEQSATCHRAVYNRSYGVMVEAWQLGNYRGYFDEPIGVSRGDMFVYDAFRGRFTYHHPDE